MTIERVLKNRRWTKKTNKYETNIAKKNSKMGLEVPKVVIIHPIELPITQKKITILINPWVADTQSSYVNQRLL
jgi:hypothetical protein